MKNFNSTAMNDDYHTSQSNLAAPAAQPPQPPEEPPAQQQQRARQQGSRQASSGALDEMSREMSYLTRDAPLDGGESTFGGAASYSHLGPVNADDLEADERLRSASPNEAELERRWTSSSADLQAAQLRSTYEELALDQLAPDNVDIQRPLQQTGFLVSFMVDARGGAMRGCRHSGVRVIIPPNSAQMPMRITCRYLRRERLVHPPPLMEGEACASKIMEVGPVGAKFLGPVLIEVPHFASLRGQEREIIILRSDSGDVWREHLVEADEQLLASILRSAQQLAGPGSSAGASRATSPDQENQEPSGADSLGANGRRLTRIVTNQFPQYFAIISRIRQQVHSVGPEGTTVNSQVVPRVSAIFTEGALTKRIKIGLQPKSAKKDSANGSNQAQEPSDQHQQQQHSLESADLQRSSSPTSNQQQQHDSLLHDSSLTSSELVEGQRASSPGSQQRASKRRSRLLACFGAGQGSRDLLGPDESGSESPAGRQPCKEPRVSSRHILGDVSESEGEADEECSFSAGASSTGGSPRRARRSPDLVPDDYYIEREPPLILNSEPTTYGKRLASSAAQTDSKPGGQLSTRADTNKSKGSRGLLRGRRKNKTQLNIRSQRAEGGAGAAADDASSIIEDVITSDDHKWRTCTIQTDSDSVTVNYVAVASMPAEQLDAATCTRDLPAAGATGTQDDGYVSGSGDLGKQPASKGFFGLAKTKRSRSPAADSHSAPANQDHSISSSTNNQPDDASAATAAATAEDSAASAKSKRQLKLEREQQLRRLKEEKRQQKELDEAAAKAAKLQKRQEKEAKKAQKVAQKLAKKASSPAPESPAPESGAEQPQGAKVTFASDLVEQPNAAGQLDSIERVIEATASDYEREKLRLSQADGSDLVRMSIGDQTEPIHRPDEQQPQPPTQTNDQQPESVLVEEQKLISFSDSEGASKSPDLLVRQQSGELSEAELLISEHRQTTSDKVSEASEAAVRAADELKLAASAHESSESALTTTTTAITESATPSSPSKVELAKEAKEAKQKAKREAKEAARAAKEAAKAAKEAEAAMKVQEAQQKKLQAKEAKQKLKEEEKLKKAAKAAAAKEAKEATGSLVAPAEAVQPSAPQADALETVEAAEEEMPQQQQALEGLVEVKESQDVVTTVSELDDKANAKAKEKEDKKTKKKSKRDAKAKQAQSSSDASELPSKSSGFFHRLFGSKRGKESQLEPSEEPQGEPNKQPQQPDKELILSEMYPTNPEDLDGEMILEVNVPSELLEQQQQELQNRLADANQKSEISIDSTLATSNTLPTRTTIDESLVSEAVGASAPADESGQLLNMTLTTQEEIQTDDQATLVNVDSQLATSEVGDDEDDDEATENLVISQANELAQEIIETATTSAVAKELGERQVVQNEVQPDEQQQTTPLAAGSDVADKEGDAKEESSSKSKKKAKKSKEELKLEREMKELEEKLAKEEEKREKEEKEAKKKEEKEKAKKAKLDKKLAELEAKKKAKEEKLRAKLEAKEAKRLAKQAKRAQKSSKSADLDGAAPVASGSDPAAATPESEPSDQAEARADQDSPATAAEQVVAEGDAAAAEPKQPEQTEPDELANMTPVNTETEVEKIVEEVVDDEGVLTRTTKTIETKYVTLRHEEVKSCEHREMPVEEYEQLLAERNQTAASSSSAPVAAYEHHEELEAIRSVPSYFGEQYPAELLAEANNSEAKLSSMSPKKVMQKRVKLNQRLIKRAYKLAKSEAGVAKKCAKRAKAEIPVCEEAARDADRELRRALKETKRAKKLVAKAHKRMDKVDKKLAKQQAKIEKRQKKLDKKAAKLAKKEAKRAEKLAKKEAKRAEKAQKLERKASQKSLASGSRKSIRLEDIGEPVLRSSSRLSIGQSQVAPACTEQQAPQRDSLTADDIQVEMSLEDNQQQQAHEHSVRREEEIGADEQLTELSGDHHPPSEPLEGAWEAEESMSEQQPPSAREADEAAEEADEEIDVVSELPNFAEKKRELAD